MGSSTLWLLAICVNVVIMAGGIGAYRLFRNDPNPVSSSAFGSPKVTVVDQSSSLTVGSAPTQRDDDLGRDAAGVVGLPTATTNFHHSHETSAGEVLNHEFAGLFAFDSGATAPTATSTRRG